VTRRLATIAAAVLTGACLGHRGLEAQTPASSPPVPPTVASRTGELDRIFGDAILARALMAVHVVSVTDGRTVYELNADKLVMPASNMKLITIATAADRLGWDYRYRTTLEMAGSIERGVLRGDLVVTGSGDPSIGSSDQRDAPLFLEWADALTRAGVQRIDGRIIGDDNAFDDAGIGAGWAWDYLTAGYAAPTGALSYNENVIVLRVSPGAEAGSPAAIFAGPPGSDISIANQVTTSAAGTTAAIELARTPGSAALIVRGQIPAGASTIVRTTTVQNPTRFFVEGLRLALATRGITTTGGAWDIDDVSVSPSSTRTLVAEHTSEPLSTLAGYAMKVSQNFYGETFFKTLGRTTSRAGTADGGREVVLAELESLGVPRDSVVMYDGSGLSRYNYVTARTLTTVLRHVWMDERLRGPFVAELPVGGHDGTLETRMKDAELDRRVQAKTGSINNVRALSGFVETASGEKLAFSMIANNYTAPNAAIDAVVERALKALVAASHP
jgi:D-alanyl-D-alanine carboxypeptidase/D-alanyl-D-alanine-endopeptidase (penicillin-binding protein 4)